MFKTYIPKSSKFEAIQWDGSNYSKVKDFCGIHPRGHGDRLYSVDGIVYIATHSGREVKVNINDYIVFEASDKILCYDVITEYEFNRLYEELQ